MYPVHLDLVVILLLTKMGNLALAVTVSEIIIKTGEDATNADITAKICDGAGVCCETGKLDKSGNDFKSGSTDIFKDPKILGSCATSQKAAMDPDADKWNVTLKKGRMFDDWFVDWVKVKTNAPTAIFHCNFTTLLDSSFLESIKKKEPEAVATCSKNDLALISNSTKANLDGNSSRGVKDVVRDKKGIFIALICAAVLLLTIGVAVVIWKFCFQKKLDQHQQVKEVDNNPVYGLYYSSSGDRVDEGTTEAVDENNYYGQ